MASAITGPMLEAFAPKQVERVRSMVDTTPSEDWPRVRTLGILFTSRSGSSHLGREISRRFAVGRIEESLNSDRINAHGGGADGLRRIIDADREGEWFAYKSGTHGLIVGEAIGFLPAVRDLASIIFLYREDLVAQAVSLVKAQQTAYWHSTSKPSRVEPQYDCAAIAQQLAFIEHGMRIIQGYIDRTGRPHLKLAYESFEGGIMTAVDQVCASLGAPKRPEIAAATQELRRTFDGVNAEWISRFSTEMDGRTRDTIARYRRTMGLDVEAPA